MVGMLVIVAVGYVAGELDYPDDHTIEHISNLVIDIAMPCLVVSSATELDPSAVSTEVPWSFALATVLWFALLGTCLLCNHLLRTPREQHGPYLSAGTCTNTSFPGIPIAFAILGQRSAVGASIFDMVTTVLDDWGDDWGRLGTCSFCTIFVRSPFVLHQDTLRRTRTAVPHHPAAAGVQHRRHDGHRL